MLPLLFNDIKTSESSEIADTQGDRSPSPLPLPPLVKRRAGLTGEDGVLNAASSPAAATAACTSISSGVLSSAMRQTDDDGDDDDDNVMDGGGGTIGVIVNRCLGAKAIASSFSRCLTAANDCCLGGGVGGTGTWKMLNLGGGSFTTEMTTSALMPASAKMVMSCWASAAEMGNLVRKSLLLS